MKPIRLNGAWALLAVGVFVALPFGFSTATADPFCELDCTNECIEGDTQCLVECCEEACDTARRDCRKGIHEQRKTTKKQCKIDREQAKNDCETTLEADLVGCRAVACLNDPNQDFSSCRKAAKAARDQCRDVAKATRNQCRTNTDADRETGEANCDLVEGACMAACQGP